MRQLLKTISRRLSGIWGREVADGRNRLTQICNLLPGVYYRMEFEPEVVLTNIGPDIVNLLGYKSKDLLNKKGLSYLRDLNPDHERIVTRKRIECTKGREVKTLQYNMYTKSGSVRLIEDRFVGEYDGTGRLIAVNGYLKEFKTSPVKSNPQSQPNVHPAAIDGNIISSITDERGMIIYANEEFRKTSQYTDEELLGKTHRVVRSGHHPASFFGDMWKTISSGKTWYGDICNRAKDGSIYWVAAFIIPLFGENNEIYSYLSLYLPIADPRQSEEQKSRSTRVLGEIADAVARDVRGPECSILRHVNVLVKTYYREEARGLTMEYFLYAAKKLDEWIRDHSAKVQQADKHQLMPELTEAREIKRSMADES